MSRAWRRFLSVSADEGLGIGVEQGRRFVRAHDGLLSAHDLAERNEGATGDEFEQNVRQKVFAKSFLSFSRKPDPNFRIA